MITDVALATFCSTFYAPVAEFELLPWRAFKDVWTVQPRRGVHMCARIACDTEPTTEECETIIRLWALRNNVELADELQIRRVRE